MSHWDAKTAQWYADKYGEYATNRLGINNLSFDGVSVLVDIGCGTGCALRHAASKIPDAQLIGIDPVPRMLEIAKEQTEKTSDCKAIEYRQGSAESLPVENNEADLVLAFDSFDHWQQPDVGLTEVFRILKPGGKFALVKDGGAPTSSVDKNRFLAMLARAGFMFAGEFDLKENDVHCVQWIFVKT